MLSATVKAQPQEAFGKDVAVVRGTDAPGHCWHQPVTAVASADTSETSLDL